MEKSAYFRREGADVHTDADISLAQAVLGGTIRAQGVYEDQVIQVSNRQPTTGDRFQSNNCPILLL